MRGVVLQGERDVSVETLPDPSITRPDSVIVKVDATAICGSDLHLYHGMGGMVGTRLGHEFIGTVVECGDDVRITKTGDRVLVSGVIGCGTCIACLSLDPTVCRNGGTRVFGTRPDLHGGQAEYAEVPAADTSVFPISDGVSDASAVLLTDILPTGYLGAQMAEIRPGSTVAVIGLGPVGLMALHCAKLYSPARILAIDPVPERRERAETLGAEVIDPNAGGTAPQVLATTGGWGADATIEAVGADGTITDGLACASPGSVLSIIGVNLNPGMPFPLILATLKRLTIRTTLASVPSTWKDLVPLVATGKLQADDVFTHHLGLSEAAEAYRLFDAHQAMKVMLDPSR